MALPAPWLHELELQKWCWWRLPLFAAATLPEPELGRCHRRSSWAKARASASGRAVLSKDNSSNFWLKWTINQIAWLVCSDWEKKKWLACTHHACKLWYWPCILCYFVLKLCKLWLFSSYDRRILMRILKDTNCLKKFFYNDLDAR